MSQLLTAFSMSTMTTPIVVYVPTDCVKDFILANHVGIDWDDTCKHDGRPLSFLYDLMKLLYPHEPLPWIIVDADGIGFAVTDISSRIKAPTFDIAEACYMLCDSVAKHLLAQPVAELPPVPASTPDHESAQF